jgi:hypothetical protein
MITMEAIIGGLISGFAVRLYGAGLALYVGLSASDLISSTLASATATLATLP